MEGGDGVDELDGLGGEDAVQRFGKHPVVVGFNLHVAGFVRIEGLEGAEVGGAFDGNDIAGGDEDFAKVVEDGLGAAEDQDLVGGGGDAASCEVGDEGLAEGAETLAGIVLEGLRPVAGEDGTHELFHEVEGEALLSREAAGEGHDAGRRRHLEDLADSAGFHVAGAGGEEAGVIHGTIVAGMRNEE